MIKNFFDEHNINYKEEISLKNYNTYKINTNAKFLVYPSNEKELILILKKLKEDKIKYFILGNGSNIIFSMDYYDGVIIKLDNLNQVEYYDDTVTVGAGCLLNKIALETVKKGYSGLIFATGIPGTVGASTAMNAGAYNSDMSNVVKSVKVLNENNEIITLNNKDLMYTYRDSYLKSHKNLIVLSTTFKLTKDENIEDMKKQIEERCQKRIATQPLNEPNAGSVFRNPDNMYAGELIEKSNLKGYNINGAEISTKHANFIVNKGGATGKDIIELIKKVQKEIKEKYNVDLKLEQIIVE
ncbi:MAG: UDP-N-acetylmuramate dehydrogenase [Mycoplasmatota bacterium]|nr:UDP-N-acetylmuramate dehydrogenase [Mycoplasmatota bacterium]